VVPTGTVAGVLRWAAGRYGEKFEALLPSCQVWVNGEPADEECAVSDGDEVAVIPPVSGGS
jgi:sulfur-carrier protein